MTVILSLARKCVVVVVLLLITEVLANRAVMNPPSPGPVEIDPDAPPRAIRNGHGDGPAPPTNAIADPPNEKLKPELRVSHPASEVIQLLEEDDMRTTDPKHPSSVHQQDVPRMDCSKITMQIFQVLLQNPDTVEPEDYSCGLLNLISHFEKSNGRIRALEASLHTATSTIKSLESNLQSEMSKSQFLMRELNETLHKETERAIKAENVIARRVLSEKTRVDTIQKNLTESLVSALDQVRAVDGTVRNLELQWQSLAGKQMMTPKEPQTFSPSPQILPVQQSTVNDQEIRKIELKLSTLQEFIQELSNRISQMEDGSEEHVNKGITQIFKTYASLAHEIEKETERATSEEASLKTYINNEISTLSKSVTGLQERISEEKNRVQVIENRRTADLFEEINRAKSEENRLAMKLKEEMSKAAAAFKRLELHVDVKLNSSTAFEDEFKQLSENITKQALETEAKLSEQIIFERTRALSVETSLKSHLETEVTRAMSAENELKRLTSEERERARAAEHDLKVALDVEAYRAKGVEFSISAQVSAETERAKQEEQMLHEHISANVTRLLTDIIKEFTRAQNAEKELEEKMNNERSRASSVEQTLMTNLNNEVTRATDREQELFRLIKSKEESTSVLDKVRNLIEEETFRATKAEAVLEGQINTEVIRARGAEERLQNLVSDDLLEKFRNVEVNVTATTSDILRHTKELELEVRKTVMAEVARAVDAENGLKQQLSAEIERATQAELFLEKCIIANSSDISSRLQDMTKEIEKDNLRLEDISLQISRNLTGDILTLAELFDDKLDDLERSENLRLKKVEDDMKKCCSGSSWRWRSTKNNGKATSTSERASARSDGVISKIMQVFGSITEDTSSKKKSGRPSSTDRSLKSTPIDADDKKEDIHLKPSEPRSIDSSIVTGSRSNQTVVLPSKTNTLGELEKIGERRQLRKKPLAVRNSRIVISNSDENTPIVSVQSANSKVTNTFG